MFVTANKKQWNLTEK